MEPNKWFGDNIVNFVCCGDERNSFDTFMFKEKYYGLITKV